MVTRNAKPLPMVSRSTKMPKRNDIREKIQRKGGISVDDAEEGCQACSVGVHAILRCTEQRCGIFCRRRRRFSLAIVDPRNKIAQNHNDKTKAHARARARAVEAHDWTRERTQRKGRSLLADRDESGAQNTKCWPALALRLLLLTLPRRQLFRGDLQRALAAALSSPAPLLLIVPPRLRNGGGRRGEAGGEDGPRGRSE